MGRILQIFLAPLSVEGCRLGCRIGAGRRKTLCDRFARGVPKFLDRAILAQAAREPVIAEHLVDQPEEAQLPELRCQNLSALD
ncbi:MAG: hypothetical protein EOO83_00360 [Oxalobacteraceae bacterium]|nr:MAG: hypothetical protein EOO83_00360 [Oxalobacteraceae bacterium]